jgi:hypothetical protein
MVLFVEHGRAAADDVRELMREPERLLQQHVLLPQLPVLDLLPHFHLEEVDVERLAQIVAGAQPHRLDRRLGGSKGRNHDPENVLIDFLGRAQHVDAAQVRHLDIRDQQVDRFALEQADGGAAVLGEQHIVAFAPQHDGQQLAHRALIVDHENAWRPPIGGRNDGFSSTGHEATTARAGRRTEMVVPAPGCEATRISPL